MFHERDGHVRKIYWMEIPSQRILFRNQVQEGHMQLKIRCAVKHNYRQWKDSNS